MIVSVPLQKKEEIVFQCQDLLNQSDVTNDPTNRTSFVNSKSCSRSTLTVPILTMSTNSRVSRETKFNARVV